MLFSKDDKVKLKDGCKKALKKTKEFEKVNLNQTMTVKGVEGAHILVKENSKKWHFDWLEKA